MNCSTISGALAESEFFGHKKGAFTGASESREGFFRAAHRGTLLLDEIGDLDLSLQPKLLRVLESQRVLPVGEDKEKAVDVRVIAATHRDLTRMLAAGSFRLDLYQRLNVIPIRLPSLRERPEDLIPLIKGFASKHNYHLEDADHRVAEALAAVKFEGNVRELENVIRRILYGKRNIDGRLELRDLPKEILAKVVASRLEESDSAEAFTQQIVDKLKRDQLSLSEVLDDFEKLVFKAVLQETEGNRRRAAQLLKTSQRTVFSKIRKYRLDMD